MPLTALSFFILGVAVASVTANETVTASNQFGSNNYSSTVTLPNTTFNVGVTTTSNITWGSSTISPLTTMPKGGENATSGNTTQSPTPMMIEPTEPSKSTTTAAKKDEEDTSHRRSSDDSTGIIILVVIILVAVAFGVVCYFARKRGRRYSVDFTSRPDEANIPLSAVEPELPIDAAPQNGLQTFESTETTAKEPQEAEATPEAQEEQKAEPNKPVADPSAESAAPAAPPDISEDKPRQEVVEPTPAAPVEEKTDDEGAVSNKTSVESLKETNENNSNSADISQMSDSKRGIIFWDVPLDCPV